MPGGTLLQCIIFAVRGFPTPRPTDNRAAPRGQEPGVAEERQGDRMCSGTAPETGPAVKPGGSHAKSTAVTMPAPASWTPDSWKTKTDAQAIAYDPAALEVACARLRSLPPLVTSWEIERLKRLLAEAQEGKRFLVQGGDCAETLADCRSPVIANKLKILLQMSLVMIHEGKRPVVRVGRFAGQYAKPRSKPVESRDGVERPSYFGDLVNRPEFTESGRRARSRQPHRCVQPRGDDAQLHPVAVGRRLRGRASPRVLGALVLPSRRRARFATRRVRAHHASSSPRPSASWRRSARAASRS